MNKIILIILGLFFGNVPYLESNNQIKQPNNIITNIGGSAGYTTLYAKSSFSGTSTIITNNSDNILIAFNEGTVLKVENNSGYVQLALYDTSNNRTQLASYTYNNYTYTYSMSGYAGIMFENNYQTNNIQINSGTQTVDYTYFIDTVPATNMDIDTILLISAQEPIDQPSYNSGYENGYNVGFKEGQDDVVTSPSNFGLVNVDYYLQEIQTYYNNGYTAGIEEATTNDYSMFGLVSAIMTAPALFVKEAFNFEFFGINISNLILFLISLSIVIWIIGFFKKK